MLRAALAILATQDNPEDTMTDQSKAAPPSISADTLERIAKRHFNVATLETRNSDSLDFYDCSVWGIKAALEEAYAAGQNAGYETIVLTEALINEGKAGRENFSYDQLAELGVPFPVPPNWMAHLIGKEVLKSAYDRFLNAPPY